VGVERLVTYVEEVGQHRWQLTRPLPTKLAAGVESGLAYARRVGTVLAAECEPKARAWGEVLLDAVTMAEGEDKAVEELVKAQVAATREREVALQVLGVRIGQANVFLHSKADKGTALRDFLRPKRQKRAKAAPAEASQPAEAKKDDPEAPE
jgi:hypothetical protein